MLGRMALTLKRTGLASLAYQDWADFTVLDDEHVVGRIYEDRFAPAELRWYWSITVFVDPRARLVTHGRAATLDAAKAGFLASWNQWKGRSSLATN
jgi:hypothetical protein